jgi:hypothetical protein
MAGAIRGCGRQRVGFVVNGATFWGVGIPVAGFAALRCGLGVPGLWMGLTAASVVQLAALSAVFAGQSWRRQVERSRLLVRSQSTSGGGAAAASRRGTSGGGGGVAQAAPAPAGPADGGITEPLLV